LPTSSGNGCSQHGQNDGVVGHSGPCCHSFEAISSWVVVPIDKSSAGFTRVGQYLQLALGRFCMHYYIQKLEALFIYLFTYIYVYLFVY